MKNEFFTLLCILITLNLQGQDVYTVSVVRGEPYKNGTRINIGDRLKSNEKIVFRTKETMLIILNAKGRFIISLAGSTGSHNNELTRFLVKDNIHIHAGNRGLSTRETDYLDVADYLKTDQNINNKLLVVDQLKISVRNVGVSVDNMENFFFLQLLNNKGKGFNKKLRVIGDTLILQRADFIFNSNLYTIADGILSVGLLQGYSREKKVTKITDISPEFLTRSEVVQIIKAIKSASANHTKDEIIDEVYTQLYYFFGKPDRQVIADLFDTIH